MSKNIWSCFKMISNLKNIETLSHELFILFVTEFVCIALLEKISSIVFQVIEWPWVNHLKNS